jgi:hypothetical protein
MQRVEGIVLSRAQIENQIDLIVAFALDVEAPANDVCHPPPFDA